MDEHIFRENDYLLESSQRINEMACMDNIRYDIKGNWRERWTGLLTSGREGDYITDIAKNKLILGKDVNFVYGNENHGLLHFINGHMWETINGKLVNFAALIDAIPDIIENGIPFNKYENSVEGEKYLRIQTIRGEVQGHMCEVVIETHKETSLLEYLMPIPWVMSAYYINAKPMTQEEIDTYRKEHYHGSDNIEIVSSWQTMEIDNKI